MARPKKSDQTGIRERLSVEMTTVYGRKGAGTRLAETVGVSTGQASRWESGENIPSLGMIVRIARALSLDPGWLAFGAKLSQAPKTAREPRVSATDLDSRKQALADAAEPAADRAEGE